MASSVTPANFSWLAVGQLAGMACPTMTAHYRHLLDNGIKHLVCLCESTPPNCESCPALVLHHIAVTDFCPPRPEQIDGFLAIVERANAKGEGVGVHCMHGLGRTGTMLACFLVRTRALDGRRAIDEIRRLRPGSIETTEQETSVHDFYQRHLQVPAGKNTV